MQDWKPEPSGLLEGAKTDLRVVVAATFSPDGLDESLKVWFKDIMGGISVDLQYTGYGTLIENLSEPESAINTNLKQNYGGTQCLNLVLIRLLDLCPGVQHPENRHEILTKKQCSGQSDEKDNGSPGDHVNGSNDGDDKATIDNGDSLIREIKPEAVSLEQLTVACNTIVETIKLSSYISAETPLLVVFMPHSPAEIINFQREHLLHKFQLSVKERLQEMSIKNVVLLSSRDVLVNNSANNYFEHSTSSIQTAENIYQHLNLSPCDLKRFLGHFYNERLDRIAHAPYTLALYASLSSLIARSVHRLVHKPKKVIVLDCDYTLWGGAVSEVGVENIDLNEDYLACQKFYLELMQREGILLCLCSRNVEQDVLDVFTQRKEMVLKMENIVSYKINFEKKSKNIRALSQELGLGIDSFIFVDDNSAECSDVRENIPEILTVNFPCNKIKNSLVYLRNIWGFDGNFYSLKGYKTSGSSTTPLPEVGTSSTGTRTELYQAKAKRHAASVHFNTFPAFLASLNLSTEIKLISEETLERASELTERTNQMNVAKQVLTSSELQQLTTRDGLDVYTVEVSDRFGYSGVVAVFAIEPQQPQQQQPQGLCSSEQSMDICEDEVVGSPPPRQLRVPHFLLSCRSLHLGIEHVMIKYIATIAKERKCDCIVLPWLPSERNYPAFSFFNSISNVQFSTTSFADSISEVDELETLHKELQENSYHEKNEGFSKVYQQAIPEEMKGQTKTQIKKFLKNQERQQRKEDPVYQRMLYLRRRIATIKRQRERKLEGKIVNKEKISHMEKMKDQEIPPLGSIFLDIGAALNVELVRLPDKCNGDLNTQKEDNHDETCLRPAKRTPSGSFSALNDVSYMNIAIGFSMFTDRELYNYVEKAVSRIALSKEDRQSQIMNLLLKGSDNVETSDNFEKSIDLTEYQEYWRLRRKARHQVKEMLQAENPESYYKDVIL